MSSARTPGATVAMPASWRLSVESSSRRAWRIARRAAVQTQFRAMAADRRQLQRGEQPIKIVDLATAHEGERAVDAPGQPRQSLWQRRRNPDGFRSGSKIENRPVHIEQYGETIQIGCERRNDVWHDLEGRTGPRVRLGERDRLTAK